MNIIAADDEKMALEVLEKAIQLAVPEANIAGFRKAKGVLEYAKGTICDIAFLDIEMRDISGIELARKLKGINPKINIVFVTGYSNYAGDALNLRVSGYILKPVTPEAVKIELENLRNPVRGISKKHVRVQAFGNFEVFVDDEPLKFKYSKTKELFAYLIDRKGALCTNGEILGVLWEDDDSMLKKKSYLGNLRTDLIDSFSRAGCDDVLIKHRANLAVAKENVECDFFDWLDDKPYAINAYQGEYMSQYSWSETTLGKIESTIKNS